MKTNLPLVVQKRRAIEILRAGMDVLLELPDDVSNEDIIAIIAHGYVTLKTAVDLIAVLDWSDIK